MTKKILCKEENINSFNKIKKKIYISVDAEKHLMIFNTHL